MGPGQIFIFVIVGIAAIALLWLFLAKSALPPAEERKQLERHEEAPPEPAVLEKPAEEGGRVDEKAPPAPAEEDAEGEAKPAEPVEAVETPPAEEAPRTEDEVTAREDISTVVPPVEAPSEAPAAKPARFAPPPTVTPPPTLKKIPTLPPIEAPKVEAPKVEAPKVEAPKVEAPKVEAPKVEAPKPEAPKPEPKPVAPVPMPIEKPTVPTREQLELAELESKKSERDRYRAGLKKTKRGFIAKLARLFKGKPKVSDDLKDEIEEVLFTADIGSKTASALLESVTAELDKKEVADPDAVWAVIRQKALEILDIEAQPLDYQPAIKPYTLLMIGVNGVGKTTTIGKLAARHVEAGRKTLMVAGDTFRAAAGEQLEVWARRVGCDIHMGKEGADPSSVLFDGIMRGRNEGYDVVLCDTAGRLHTRKELMDELGKMGRAAAKALSKGREEMEPQDTFLVLDATIGQNALAQAQMFKETMNFSGLVLTKLDGTAKGGVVIGVVDELRVPIRYIGIGERVDDLRRFDPEAFCDVLFRPDENNDDEDEG
jgi:fused signal recognition particle receptor